MGYYHDKAIKEIKRANIFPAWKTYDYIAHESNNKYVIVFLWIIHIISIIRR